jgi:hypothetical protein
MSFQQKYLKYKNKYLDLKNLVGGSGISGAANQVVNPNQNPVANTNTNQVPVANTNTNQVPVANTNANLVPVANTNANSVPVPVANANPVPVANANQCSCLYCTRKCGCPSCRGNTGYGDGCGGCYNK